MNGYPYYTPEAPAPDPQQQFVAAQQANEKRKIRRFSWGAALATGAFFLLGNLLYLPFMAIFKIQPLETGSESEIVLQLCIDTLITVFSLFVPFFITYRIFRSRDSIRPIRLGASRLSAPDTVLFVFAGLGLLLLAGEITGQLSWLFESLTGIEFSYAFFATPKSAFGIFIYALRSTLLPALVEEYAMRGVVLNSLRRYGDGFAIFMSALVFALMHGNMVQAPFALLAGFVLGYVAIRTGTLWVPILIHFLNNSFSVVITVCADNISEQTGNTVSTVGTTAILLVGGVCLALLFVRKQITKLRPNRSFLPTGQCVKNYILTVPMILVLVYMLFQTAVSIALPNMDLGDAVNWVG